MHKPYIYDLFGIDERTGSLTYSVNLKWITSRIAVTEVTSLLWRLMTSHNDENGRSSQSGKVQSLPGN